MNIRKLIPAAVIVAGLVLAPVAAHADAERLPVCHSGSGVNWVHIAPDASGYNGHQHHDADVFGLSEAECLALNVVEPPVEEVPVEETPVVDETPFILIAWPMAEWIDDTTPTWPQGVAAGLAAPFTVDLATRNLNALDSTLTALTVPCETSVQFQVDGNFDTESVRSAIAGGSLYGPNNPAEALWGGGWGEAYKLVKIDGPACPPVAPEPRVVVFDGEWTGGEPSCTVPEVVQERVVVTSSIPWKVILVEGLYQVVEDLENASHDTNVETRTLTYDGDPCVVPVDEEPTPEPTVEPTVPPAAPQADALAATGVEPYDGWLFGAMGAALLLAGIALVAGIRDRRRAEK